MIRETISTGILCASSVIVVMAGAHTPAVADTLLVKARNDKPGPVTARLETYKKDGTKIEEVLMTWEGNDNGFTEADSGFLYGRPRKFRITFIDDACCGADEDADRNLFISQVKIAYFPGGGQPGILVVRDGADWDATGGTDDLYPGCEVATVMDSYTMQELETAACGNEYDWVTYSKPAQEPIPTLSSLGVILLMTLLLAGGISVIVRRRRSGERVA
jgi:hypothetical protein